MPVPAAVGRCKIVHDLREELITAYPPIAIGVRCG